MSQPIIKIKGITRDFPLGQETVYVLKGIDLVINKGEYVALMGPSGSGKSTLMNILGCLDTPTGGSYILNSKDVSQMSDNELAEVRNKEIGFVFQTFNLMPRTTALENVALPLMIRGMNFEKAKSIALKMLEEVEMVHRESFFPGKLSGGEKQRTAIARALIIEPKIIFADEPTGNLDWTTSTKIADMLIDLNKK